MSNRKEQLEGSKVGERGQGSREKIRFERRLDQMRED